MFDVLVRKIPISDVISRSRSTSRSRRSISPGAELALSSLIGRERSLEKALIEVRDSYDFVLIDTPPSLGLLTINAFVAATGVIVPVQCEYLSLRGLVQLENTLAMVRENLNPHVGVEGIVPTMYDGRTLHAREAVEILEENFGDLVYKTRIRKTVRYAEAPVKGTSVLKYDPTGPARPRRTASSRRRCCMARKRASMREGPLAELFRATEAAQRAQPDEPSEEEAPALDTEQAAVEEQETLLLTPQPEPARARDEPGLDATVEHVYDFGEDEPEPSAVEQAIEEPPSARERARAEGEAEAGCAARRARAARPRRAAVRAAGQPLPAPDARGRTAPQRGWRSRVVPRGDPRRRRRRRRAERGQPDDGRGHRAGRLRRRQHRHAAARRSRTPPSRSTSARS